ncbi:MAG: tetratricopeptide (TPR) repeat protein, partial [Arcticibacterium sp.]
TDALVKDAQDASDYFPNQAFFWYHYGYGNVLKKDYNEAIYALEEAKALAFDNVELSKHISSLLGDSFHATKRYTEAYKAYDQVLELDPNYAPALNNYSYFLAIEKKDLDKAQLLSERLYSLDPDNIEYIDTYGWVLFQKGDYDAAKAIIEKAVKNHTELNGTILEHYGDILYKLGDASLAHEQWKKAKELGENSIHIDSKILKKQYIE